MTDKVTIQNGFRLNDVATVQIHEQGQAPITIELSGTFFMATSGTVEGIHYRSLVSTVASQAGGVFIVGFFEPFERFFVNNPFGTVFSMSFDSSQTARLFGFNSTVSEEATILLTGASAPWNYWREHKTNRSKWVSLYEPKEVYHEHISDNGTVYSIGRSGSVKYADWKFEVQPRDRIRQASAPDSRRFTWEDFIYQTRTVYPFLVHTGSLSTFTYDNRENTYRLRDEGSFFAPEFIFPDYEDYLNVSVKAYILEH